MSGSGSPGHPGPPGQRKCIAMENQHSNSLPLPFESSEWTFEENKLFENAIAESDIFSPDLFQKIALRLPGKTVEQIIRHFESLAADVKSISSSHLPILKNVGSQVNFDKSTTMSGGTSTGQLNRKQLFWTDDEHKNFLKGLARHGRGDWKSISKPWVPTRTPAQVASHAQKYFHHLETKGAFSSNSEAKTVAEYVPQSLEPSLLEDYFDPLPNPYDPKTVAKNVPQPLEPSLLEDHFNPLPIVPPYDPKTVVEDVPQPLEPSLLASLLEDHFNPLPILPPYDPKTVAENVPQPLEPNLLENHFAALSILPPYDPKTVAEDVPQPLESSPLEDYFDPLPILPPYDPKSHGGPNALS